MRKYIISSALAATLSISLISGFAFAADSSTATYYSAISTSNTPLLGTYGTIHSPAPPQG